MRKKIGNRKKKTKPKQKKYRLKNKFTNKIELIKSFWVKYIANKTIGTHAVIIQRIYSKCMVFPFTIKKLRDVLQEREGAIVLQVSNNFE